MYLEHRLSALLQLHLHYSCVTWLRVKAKPNNIGLGCIIHVYISYRPSTGYIYIYIYIWLLRSGELIWKKRNRRKALKIFLSVHLKDCSSLIGLHLKELGELRNQGMYSLQARGHEWYRGERGNANGTGKYKIYNKKNAFHTYYLDAKCLWLEVYGSHPGRSVRFRVTSGGRTITCLLMSSCQVSTRWPHTW